MAAPTDRTSAPLPTSWTTLGRPYRILLVEDDQGDALLVEATLEESLAAVEVVWHDAVPSAGQVAEARADCVLVDLGLPGLAGLEALEAMLALVDTVPVVVLTGLDDRATGLAAVAKGAADYLVKGDHAGEELARAIGFAVERTHAEAARSRLREAEYLRAENVRLERGLLPRPMLDGSDLVWARRYRPGAETSVLGGDFFDAVQRSDGTVRVVLGDVSGHGPAEAALGVCLRIAWRTLVLCGTPDDEVLATLDEMLVAERQDRQFCTAVDLTLAADRRSLSLRLAGHPPPILLGPEPAFLPGGHRGLPLGVSVDRGWPSATVDLEAGCGLVAFSDGAFEPVLADGEQLGLAGLLGLVGTEPCPSSLEDLETLLDLVERPHVDAGHSDDLALIGLLLP